MLNLIEKYTGIGKSVQASGLIGGIAYVLALLAQHYGFMVDWQTLVPIIGGAVVFVSHVVPDGVKTCADSLNVDAKKLAAALPELRVESGPGDYPDSVDKPRR